MQRHLGGHVLQCPHLEVRGPHPGLYGAERMLDGLAPQGDPAGVIIETLLSAL